MIKNARKVKSGAESGTKKKHGSRGAGNANGALAQVAERAQVSIGTVSRVFNNSPLISATTRARVLGVARDLGFRPRVGVRAKQIALVTEPPQKTVMGGYVNTLTQYLCYALSRADANISLITEDRLDMLSDNRFDGVIGIAWRTETLKLLKNFRRTPVVWFSDDMRKFFHTVYLDNAATGRLAGDYLWGCGHRRIAVIHDPDYCGEARAAGLTAAVLKNGGADDTVIKITNTSPLHFAVKHLIDSRCTAVWVTGEDLKVLEVNWLLQELVGKKVPEEISLLGFENPGVSEFIRPALTTIVSPLREMAEKAAAIILSSENKSLQSVSFAPALIERNSVQKI